MMAIIRSTISLWQLCEGNLAPEIVDQMKKDCEKLDGDLDAIRDLFNNIEVVCAAKGVNVTLIITIIDCCKWKCLLICFHMLLLSCVLLVWCILYYNW